jgi:hypothetical protein
MSVRDVCGSVGVPIAGEQEGENPAFRVPPEAGRGSTREQGSEGI